MIVVLDFPRYDGDKKKAKLFDYFDEQIVCSFKTIQEVAWG